MGHFCYLFDTTNLAIHITTEPDSRSASIVMTNWRGSKKRRDAPHVFARRKYFTVFSLVSYFKTGNSYNYTRVRGDNPRVGQVHVGMNWIGSV
jgi:hypothetical protein